MPSSNSCSLALWDSPSLPLQSLLPTPASPGSSAHSWESPARIPETISPTPTPSPPRQEETSGDTLDPSQQLSLDTLGQAKRQLCPASPPRTPTLTSSLPPLFLALVGRLVSWEVRLWWPRWWQLASQEKTVSGLGGRSVPHSRRYKEEAWGQFLLRNPPPLPRTKGAEWLPCQAFRARWPTRPSLSPSARPVASAQELHGQPPRRMPQHPGRFKRWNPPTPASPPRAPSPSHWRLPLEPPGHLRFLPQFSHPAPRCGEAPHTGGAEAVRRVRPGMCGRPKGARGEAGSAEVWAMGAGSL